MVTGIAKESGMQQANVGAPGHLRHSGLFAVVETR
jgi:hypothetical protein